MKKKERKKEEERTVPVLLLNGMQIWAKKSLHDGIGGDGEWRGGFCVCGVGIAVGLFDDGREVSNKLLRFRNLHMNIIGKWRFFISHVKPDQLFYVEQFNFFYFHTILKTWGNKSEKNNSSFCFNTLQPVISESFLGQPPDTFTFVVCVSEFHIRLYIMGYIKRV